MDLMLALTEDAVHEVIWTETLLAEWERVIVRQHRRSAESAASITAAIREFFPESQIVEQDYATLVTSMPGADPDDRHHTAAAISGLQASRKSAPGGTRTHTVWILKPLPAADWATGAGPSPAYPLVWLRRQPGRRPVVRPSRQEERDRWARRSRPRGYAAGC